MGVDFGVSHLLWCNNRDHRHGVAKLISVWFDTLSHLLLLLKEKMGMNGLMSVIYLCTRYTHRQRMSIFHQCMAQYSESSISLIKDLLG